MITSILAAIAVGTFWFWLLTIVASIVFIACVEHDHYTWPTILLVLFGLVYWKAIVAISWPAIAIFVGGYAIAGVSWSVYKWYRFVQKKAFYYRERYGLSLSESNKNDLKSELKVSNHKAKLTGWIAYWPWSLLWSITGDFFNMLYDAMVNIYQKIVDRALGEFKVEDPKTKIDPTMKKGKGYDYDN